MALIVDALLEILRKPGDTAAAELVLFSAPICIALLSGLLVGWAWRPRWAASLIAHRRVPELTSESLLKALLPGCMASFVSDKGTAKKEEEEEAAAAVVAPPLSRPVPENEKLSVTAEDLEHLCKIVEERDGGRPWIHMMERALPGMAYQAWRRDPENGPPQYRSRTIYEDVAPEVMRDFFWDDEFRIKNGWDDMLLYHETIEECPKTGTMMVHWVRKFPFFCSDREYTIGRRIWELEGTYYCVTKGVPCSSIPRRNKPRRVDLYYSSWCIRAVESNRGDGQMTACEVLLFHHEDMGIPWEIAKLGIRQGMWGCVKKIEPGLRAYQNVRRSEEPLSRCAQMAQVTTKINTNYLRTFETNDDALETSEAEEKKPWGLSKFLMVGGAVALACTLDHGLVTKAVIFGVARRFAKPGRRL